MSIKKFQSIISLIETTSIHVIDETIPKNSYVSLDLSKDSIELQSIDVSSSIDLGTYINQHIKNNNAQVAYGGYLETRGIYARSSYFKKKMNALDERNIHLGLDVWVAAGTNVLAAIDGEIHSYKNNLNHGDYGPTLIMKHQVEDFTFYTLYGHLSIESLSGIELGMHFKQGDTIAQLGIAKVNGDYPPHLHFQIIIDIENYSGDYPGVSSINTLEFYKNNCPDPKILLNF